MDAQRHVYQKSGDPRDLVRYSELRDAVERNLSNLHAPVVLPSELENKRRGLVKEWIAEVGDVAMTKTKVKPANSTGLNAESDALLSQIDVYKRQKSKSMTKPILQL